MTIDSTPIAIESNEFIWLTIKKSIAANIKNMPQIGKMAFFNRPGEIAKL